jgi:IS5 family transposase
MPGSGPKPYLLQRKDKVYSCTCSIWKHIDDIEQRRTCKHLRQLRGEKAETGRVGEDGIRKSDEKLKELLEADAKLRQMHAGQAGPAGTCSSLGKRPMESADAAAVKKPHIP